MHPAINAFLSELLAKHPKLALALWTLFLVLLEIIGVPVASGLQEAEKALPVV